MSPLRGFSGFLIYFTINMPPLRGFRLSNPGRGDMLIGICYLRTSKNPGRGGMFGTEIPACKTTTFDGEI